MSTTSVLAVVEVAVTVEAVDECLVAFTSNILDSFSLNISPEKNNQISIVCTEHCYSSLAKLSMPLFGK